MTSHRPHLGAARFSIFLSVYIGGPRRPARSASSRCATQRFLFLYCRFFFFFFFVHVPPTFSVLCRVASSRQLLPRPPCFWKPFRKNVLLKRFCRAAKFPRLGCGRTATRARFSFFPPLSLVHISCGTQAGNLCLFALLRFLSLANRSFLIEK